MLINIIDNPLFTISLITILTYIYIYIFPRFILSWITVVRVKLEHPVQFPSRLIVPSPARLSVTPWASEKRATDSRKEALSARERRRRRRRRRRWKKQQGRERWRTEGGSGKRGRKEARKCGGVDSTVLRGFRAAAGLPRARPNFYQKRALLFPFHRPTGILGIFFLFRKFSFQRTRCVLGISNLVEDKSLMKCMQARNIFIFNVARTSNILRSIILEYVYWKMLNEEYYYFYYSCKYDKNRDRNLSKIENIELQRSH